MKILSTKILSPSQKALFKGYELEEVSMIEIFYGEGFVIDEPIENAVFTSANSVKSVFGIHQNKKEWFQQVYCVGNKTQYLLEEHGIEVAYTAQSAYELGTYLANYFTKEVSGLKQISWFCGNLKNNDLPTLMAENGVLVTEYKVYNTDLIPKKVATDFDAVLFFSPSGIQSFLQQNKTTKAPVICIGSTTATAAIQHFENVFISERVSVTAVIEKAKEIIEINRSI